MDCPIKTRGKDARQLVPRTTEEADLQKTKTHDKYRRLPAETPSGLAMQNAGTRADITILSCIK